MHHAITRVVGQPAIVGDGWCGQTNAEIPGREIGRGWGIRSPCRRIRRRTSLQASRRSGRPDVVGSHARIAADVVGTLDRQRGERAVHRAALDRATQDDMVAALRVVDAEFALPMNVRLKSDIVNVRDVVGDARRDRVVVERRHRPGELVEQVRLVGDSALCVSKPPIATKKNWRLTPGAARASMSRATCLNCCAMPVLSTRRRTRLAMTGGSVAVRIGLAVSFASQRLVHDRRRAVDHLVAAIRCASSATSAL